MKAAGEGKWRYFFCYFRLIDQTHSLSIYAPGLTSKVHSFWLSWPTIHWFFFLPFLTNATFKMSEVKWCCLKMFPDLNWVEFSILQSKVFSSVRPFSKPLMRRRSCQQNQVMQTCWNFTRFTSKPPSAIATQVHKTNWIIHV